MICLKSTPVWILGGMLAGAIWPALALGPLNDTGIDFCGETYYGNNRPCQGHEVAGQDVHYGRDAKAADGTLPPKVGGGGKGFDFTKIANNGRELPEDADLGDGPGDWACTRDNVTGLIWEVKTEDGGLRDQDWRYTWYDPDSPDGNPGAEGDTSTCDNTLGGKPCNTDNYTTAINAAKLCGYSDWRMPSLKELGGIVDHGRSAPAIDPDYFPNTAIDTAGFWSGSPYAGHQLMAWSVYFVSGGTTNSYKSTGGHVRLVRGKQ